MHREIDPPGEQRFLDLFGEEPLAADLGEQAVLHTVASSADGYDLDRPGGRELRISRDQAVTDERGLAQCHRAAAGTDAHGARRHADPPRRPSSSLATLASILAVRSAGSASTPTKTSQNQSIRRR